MTSNPAALIACESVLDPLLEQLATVLDEHSANFAGPIAEALERLRSTAADTSVAISAAILERGTDVKVDEFLAAAKVEVIDADRTLARRAAQLRARHRSLRLGDALSLATVGTDLLPARLWTGSTGRLAGAHRSGDGQATAQSREAAAPVPPSRAIIR